MSKPPHRDRGRPGGREQQVTTTTQLQWNGPLPPPQALEHFERVIPGGAERILAMAEREQTHRMEIEKIGIGAAIQHEGRGQKLGAFVAVVAIVAAVSNTYIGGPWQATAALVGIPVLAAVQALILGHRARKSDE